MSDDLLLTFYGDDFTGSTDVLQSLALNGVETVLFFEPPSAADLAAFPDAQAVGVAGKTRSLPPEEMTEALEPAFEAFAALSPPLCHYKVCSTFDSSPEVGSIGHAIDVAQPIFESPFVPVVVAAPSLSPRGRYVAFGNLFATVEDTTYRLDRHPTMRDHPITPMTESDLARHLGEQTDRSIAVHEILDIDGVEGTALRERLDRTLKAEPEIVVFDGLNHDHQRKVGRLVWEHCRDRDGTVFSASSSGLNYALAAHWAETGVIEPPEDRTAPDAVDQLLVMSGSASPATAAQIEWSLEHGFTGIRLDTARLIDPNESAAAKAEAVAAAVEIIESGGSPLLYAAQGRNDPAIERTNDRLEELGLDRRVAPLLGEAQGEITRSILEETGLERVCVAGGDTSGYVAPALDVYALTFASNVAPGCPLCHATSRTDAFDDLTLSLKGGQCETTNAEPDYFEVVRRGGTL